MALFDELCDVGITVQRQRLAGLKPSAPKLVEIVTAMLAADAVTGTFLDDETGIEGYVPRIAGVVLHDRWRLDERLGSGGGGEVWRATDMRDETPVAVKLIHEALMVRRSSVRRFRREFRALSQIQHDGCLRMLASGRVGPGVEMLHPERHFIVMELAAGGDLSRLIGAPTAVLLPVIQQVVAALGHIHRRQIVHRDLKPGNVLLTSDSPPRPKLADFGIIKLTVPDETPDSDSGGLVGTVDYVSPEQLKGTGLDPRSDLYSLGCMIHTLWAGRPPFEGDVMQRLVARINSPAPPLASRAPDAPSALCELTDELLATAAKDRPANAHEVARRLAALAASVTDGADVSGETALPGPATFLYDPGVVGRDAHVKTLLDAAAEVRASGERRWISLAGPAGVGKSTVSRALQRRLASDGWRTVSLTATPSAEPFAVLAKLGRALGGGDLATSPNQEVLGGGARRAQAAAEERRRQVGILSGLLRTFGGDIPVCVRIEDVHHASDDALLVLAALANEERVATGSKPTLLLTTSRPRTRRAAAQASASVELGPLDAEDAAELVRRVLGAGQEEVPSALVDSVLGLTEGSPLLIVTFLRNLVDAGSLRNTADGWQLHLPDDPGQAIDRVFDNRLTTMSPDAMTVMRVAAFVGESFEPDVVAAAANVDDAQLDRALAEALQSSIISPDTGGTRGTDRYRFVHARLAERLVQNTRRASARAVHDAVAAALVSQGAEPFEVRFHVVRGSDAVRALEALDAAAHDAHRRHDYGAELASLDLMAERIDELPTADRARHLETVAERRADALVLTGRHMAASTVFDGLAGSAETPLVQARLLRKRGLALLRTDQPGQAVESLRRSLAVLGDEVPATRTGRFARMVWDWLAGAVRRLMPGARDDQADVERALALRELAVIYRWIDLYDAAAFLARFHRLAYRLAPGEYRVDANALMGMLFSLRSMPKAGQFVQRAARELAEETGDIVGLARLTIIQAACEMMLDDRLTALSRMNEGVELARRSGDRALLVFALSSRAWTRGIIDSVPGARLDFLEAEREAVAMGDLWMATDARCGRGLTEVVLGNFDEALALSSGVLSSDVRLSFSAFDALANEARAGVALMTGRYRDALSGYQRAATLLSQHRLSEGWGWLLPMELVEATCCVVDSSGGGNTGDARRQLRAATKGIKRMGNLPLYRGCPAVASGVLAARSGKERKARRLFSSAVAVRQASRPSYMDTWVSMRPAFERLTLGDDRDAIALELDAVDAEYAARGLEGMRLGLRGMRKLRDV